MWNLCMVNSITAVHAYVIMAFLAPVSSKSAWVLKIKPF